MAKNLNKEEGRLKTWEDLIADKITDFAGSMNFVVVHTVWFVIWIVINIGFVTFLKINFDPYPFGLLTLIVSLEAIFLSTFVMISQNRQAKREEIRADLDYQTDVKAEKEIAQIKTSIKRIESQLKNLRSKDTSEVF